MQYSEVVGPRQSLVREAADRPPAGGEVVVRVLASGVCASERTAWAGHDGGDPTRLGHELSGEIAAVGPGVYGWATGDRVTGFASGAFADRVHVPAAALLPVPANMPARSALGEPLACVMEAVTRCAPPAGARIAVVGLGFMGLLALQAAAAHTPARLLGVDPSPANRELARTLGADDTLTPGDADAAHPAGFDLVLEYSGRADGLALAGRLTGRHGTLCVGGYHHDGPRSLDLDLWYRGVTLVHGFTPLRPRVIAALRAGLALVAERRLTLEPLITHTVPLDGVDTAFTWQDTRPPGFVKAVVLP